MYDCPTCTESIMVDIGAGGTRLSSPVATLPWAATTTYDVQTAYADIIAANGAGDTFHPRDAVDTRIINDIINGTGSIIDYPSDVGGWPTYNGGTPYPDSDADGMDDNWESANGLDPCDPCDHSGDLDGDGYTNLEEFFNYLVSGYSVTIVESGGSTSVDENGPTSDTYTVVLSVEPVSSVTITVDPDIDTEVNGQGAGNTTTLMFTTANWDTAQTVTVTAIDDTEDEPDPHTSTITHSASSSDTNYDGISIDNVSASVADDDVSPGVSITESGGSTSVSETGPTSDTYTVVLDTEPTSSVTITVDPDVDTQVNGNGAGNTDTLTFTTANWNSAQTVTVTAIDDTISESNPHTSTITHSASSSDTDYNGIAIDNVSASVSDNDAPVSLFSDGFESGNLDAGGWTKQNGDAGASNKAEKTGTYGARLKKTTWIEKAVSTSGYQTIHVKYARKAIGMDSGEYVYAEWYNGTGWVELESTQSSSYDPQDITCGAGADNNASFKIRFRTNANDKKDLAYIDDVEVTGIAQ